MSANWVVALHCVQGYQCRQRLSPEGAAARRDGERGQLA